MSRQIRLGNMTKQEFLVNSGEIRNVCLQITFLVGCLGHALAGIRRGFLRFDAPICTIASIVRELFRLSELSGYDLVLASETRQRLLIAPGENHSWNDTVSISEEIGCRLSEARPTRHWFESRDKIADLLLWASSFCRTLRKKAIDGGWAAREDDYAGLFFGAEDKLGELCGITRLMADSVVILDHRKLGEIATETSDVLGYILRLSWTLGIFDGVMCVLKGFAGI